MIENLLTRLLEKIAQEVGGKAASLILDESAWTKRASFDLYRALRNLEETIADAEARLSSKDLLYRSANYSLEEEEWNSRLFDAGFVYSFSLNLERAQSAFKELDKHIEIYSSRKDMEDLNDLLQEDAEVMFLMDDQYNNSEHSMEDWRKIISRTREAAKQARAMVSRFISDKFPL
jgi:hypothetical protein